MEALLAPHVDSFDAFVSEGLSSHVADLEAQEASLPSGAPQLRIWFESLTIGKPVRSDGGSLDVKAMYPAEARERGISYRAQLHGVICRQLGEEDPVSFSRALGQLPIMVRSKRCNLRGLSPSQLVARGEEGGEVGGYFICNGNERAIRLLIAPRRNHMMGIIRPSFKNRGPEFTQFAVVVRCVRRDGTSQTMALHQLSTGCSRLRVTISKQANLHSYHARHEPLVAASNSIFTSTSASSDMSTSTSTSASASASISTCTSTAYCHAMLQKRCCDPEQFHQSIRTRTFITFRINHNMHFTLQLQPSHLTLRTSHFIQLTPQAPRQKELSTTINTHQRMTTITQDTASTTSNSRIRLHATPHSTRAQAFSPHDSQHTQPRKHALPPRRSSSFLRCSSSKR